MTSSLENGDRDWVSAGRQTIDELTSEVAHQGKSVLKDASADAVHDMRTAIRRLRTAITIYGAAAPKDSRKAVERTLRRAATRLGDVRDLDVMLASLEEEDLHALAPLQSSWRAERLTAARRLTDEIARHRFDRALRRSAGLARADGGPVGTVATHAPALIWEQFGRVVAYDVDPATAEPDRIHEVRIAAKKLRYTLEAFEDAIEPGTRLIVDVTTLQDAAGEMHDSIVAGERARAILDSVSIRRRQRREIEAFADAQAQRAERLRTEVSASLATIRSRKFRLALGRAVAGMGHIAG